MPRRFLGSLILLAALGGCATAGGNPRDPLEGYNRAMFGFNEGVDNAIIKPVASGYKKVVPELARTGVSNFFSNLRDIWIGVNNILQGKVGDGASDFGRFAVNSTFGVLGLIDIASDTGLEKHNEDFGQTLGRWGVGSGAYVVLPILGPSNVRDGVSLFFVDWHGDPLWYVANIPTRNELMLVRLVDTRASLLDVGRLAEEAALDHYAYIRDAYLQRRRSLVYDGNPPPEAEPDKAPESGDGKDAPAGAGTGLPPAQITTQWGERIIGAADERITPAMEFSDVRSQSDASRQEAAGVRGPILEPDMENSNDALPPTAGTRTGFAQTILRPQ